jgi:dihydroflavonol-4-reductase
MIFLTGASGLVGNFICRKLIEEGRKVKALKRASSDLSALQDIHDQVEWVEGDILDLISLQEAMEGCEAVVHCAGMVSYHKKDADQLYRINAEGTANVVNTALRQHIKQFVHMSSVAAIGRSAKLRKIDEKFNWADADEHTAYGQSKHQAELEALRGGVEGMNVVVLNPALVLGPGPWDQSSMQVFKYVYEEKPFYTAGCMNYIDARDLANITSAALLGKLKSGERYIVSAGTISYKQFFELAAAGMKKNPPSIKVNSYLLKAAYFVELLRAKVSGKSPLITKETVKLARQQLIFNNSKIQQTLDYQFIPLTETVQWTCHKLLN